MLLLMRPRLRTNMKHLDLKNVNKLTVIMDGTQFDGKFRDGIWYWSCPDDDRQGLTDEEGYWGNVCDEEPLEFIGNFIDECMTTEQDVNVTVTVDLKS